VHVAYFGTWERGHPRNEQTISALRSAGVDVAAVHIDAWRSAHKFALGPAAIPRLLAAELKLTVTHLPEATDALVVGYPGQFDLLAARRHRKPVVFNPMVSLYDSLVDDRGRFRAGTLPARALRQLDARSFRAADVLVADTQAHADFMAELAGIDGVMVCYLGTDEQLFRPSWQRPEEFHVLFVGKLAPLHGIDVILEAARLLPDVPFRVLGTGQQAHLLAAASSNVEHVPWVEYERLPPEYASAGCALGIFGSSDKVARVIPNKIFEALAVGTPVVTADTPGIRELLGDRRDALLTERTPEAIAEAITSLRNDPALAERIGRTGRVTFEREASQDVLGPRWREVIEQAIERCG
jgi:glycosyltransferase involved in cell wall biosynthesis